MLVIDYLGYGCVAGLHTEHMQMSMDLEWISEITGEVAFLIIQ